MADYHTSLVQQLKRLCTNLPKLAIPKYGDQLIVETDASDQYWGGVLKAKKADNKEHICRYANGSFKPTEVNYHSNEKELLALKRIFAKFYFFILLVRFLVRTDNTNVKAYIFNKLPCTPEYKRRHRCSNIFRNINSILNILKVRITILLIFLAGKQMGAEVSQARDIKVLLEMEIHELCIAQERVTNIHHEIQHEIHPRIVHALSILDEVMALNAIDMEEDIHQSFLETCQRARQLQETICCPTETIQQPTIQKEGKAVDTSEISETKEDDFTVVVPKVYKPLQEPEIKKALTMEQYSS